MLQECKFDPESLQELCIKIVDQFPLPECFKWSVRQIAKWILNDVGFPQYVVR